MRFTKMEGLGNDYVYLNGFEPEVAGLADLPALARWVSDRHFGIGSDGLILLLPGERADLRMRMLNSDGSESEMCGNGLRCVASLALRRGLVSDPRMTVETGAGVLTVTVLGEEGPGRDRVRMEMGAPRLAPREIPVALEGDRAVEVPLAVEGLDLRFTAVSMGNPHAVIPVDDVASFPVERVGRAIETHPLFPNRVNVEFVEVHSPERVSQRTWERGAGETLACGTGAAAVCVAGILTGRTTSPLAVRLRGGELSLAWDGEGPVVQTGPAVTVFEGEFRWPRDRGGR